MKQTYFILILFCTNTLFSQSYESKGMIEYSMSLLNEVGINNYESVLYFNETNSKFVFKSIKNDVEETVINSMNNYSINVTKADTLLTSIYLFKENKKIYTVLEKKLENSFYEDFISQEWTISDEQKLIDKFLCFKATTTFRGRDYIAYYTVEIPMSMGPYKFGGLPGLILEIYDTTKEVYFKATKIIIPYIANFNLEIDPSLLKSRSEIKLIEKNTMDVKKKRLEDLVNKIQSSADRNTKIKINKINVTNNKGIEID